MVKTIYRLLLLIMTSLIADAQNTGLNMSGVNGGDPVQPFAGMVVDLRGESGQVRDASNNVYKWYNQIPNGWDAVQEDPTLQPRFDPLVNTNMYPGVTFYNFQKRMMIPNLGSLISGTPVQPFLMVALLNQTTNANNATAMSFGWTSATNNDASQILMRPHANVTTTHGILYSSNTNQNPQVISITAGITTNNWWYMSYLCNGTQMAQMENLRVSTVANLSANTITLDMFTIGCLTRQGPTATNFDHVTIGGLWFLTNSAANITTTLTSNVVNHLNSTYRRTYN